jgi:hypothetical protein
MRMWATLLLACACSGPPARADVRDWNFRVLLDNREIGTHRFMLTTEGERKELTSQAQFKVRFLFLDAYSYRHEAHEVWQGACLHSLNAKTVTNGRQEKVNAVAHEGGMLVVRESGREELRGCVMSFAYWNPAILATHELLNSQTGELVPVTVQPGGRQSVRVRGRDTLVDRYRIDGPQLHIDLWYAQHEWVALEAPAAGGRRLRYELL